MKSVIMAHFDLCTGCGICQLICSAKTSGSYNPRLSCLLVTMEREGILNRPTVCRQCENAFCEKICTFGAIKRNEETGALIVDRDLCKGCRKCAEICPEKVIFMDHKKKAVKCDLCSGEPLCVKYCPNGALRLVQF